MHSLYIIHVVFWAFIAIQALKTFWLLKDQGFSRLEVTSITILLLSALNISRGVLYLCVGLPFLLRGQLLLEYFYIGSSVFQILLCNIVLKYIRPKT